MSRKKTQNYIGVGFGYANVGKVVANIINHVEELLTRIETILISTEPDEDNLFNTNNKDTIFVFR